MNRRGFLALLAAGAAWADAPALGLHADVLPGRVARVPFTPGKEGSYEFACDVFCGSGHEEMGGVIIVHA
jgi:cytochrome c oxidase subunit 2